MFSANCQHFLAPAGQRPGWSFVVQLWKLTESAMYFEYGFAGSFMVRWLTVEIILKVITRLDGGHAVADLKYTDC